VSWDLFIQDLPRSAESIADIPDDFEPSSLGPRDALIAAIRVAIPHADFSDPAWGVLEGPDYSIEFNIGDDDEVGCIALHVRGGDGAAAVVHKLLTHLGLRALDSGTGEFFEFDGISAEGLRVWREFRDSVVGEHPGD
jgi:hypothetical protein